MSAQATFAMGCFWHPEVVFRNVEGVLDAEVGYTGGHEEDPTYEEVCSGRTGHAEAVRITFDPERITYEELLDVFFREHDPTQLNRQGLDIGSQYRSAIYWHDPDQREKALQAIERRRDEFRRRIVTEVEEAGPFFRAEEYHQQYLVRRGMASCRI